MDDDLTGSRPRRFDPIGRFGVRVTLFGLALVLAAVPFGLLLAEVSTDGRFTRIDSSLARDLNERVAGNEGLVTALEVVTFLGKPAWLYVAVGLPVLWLLRRGDRRLAVFLAVTCLAGGLINSLVKILVSRPRPLVQNPIATASGKSFPSGHSMGSMICYGALVLVFLPLVAPRWRRWVVVLAAFLVAAIGLSRLGLGVHFLSDVLGGFILGIAWLMASVAAFQIWRIDRGRRPSEVLDDGVEPELDPRPPRAKDRHRTGR